MADLRVIANCFKILIPAIVLLLQLGTAQAEPPRITNSTYFPLGASESFSWNDGDEGDVSTYWLYLGSELGRKDYFDSGNIGTTNSVSVTGIPTNGDLVYARLWYKYGNGSWNRQDHVFRASTPLNLFTSLPASFSSASSGELNLRPLYNVLASAGSPSFWLYAGSSPRSSNYYNSGLLQATTEQAASTSSLLRAPLKYLPTDGSVVHVTVWYRTGSGPWNYKELRARSSTNNVWPIVPVEMPYQWPEKTVFFYQGDTAHIEWLHFEFDFYWNDYIGRPVGHIPTLEYWVYAGSTPGGRQYFNSGNLGPLPDSIITNLPTDGSDVYVTLWYRELVDKWRSSTDLFRAGNTTAQPIFPLDDDGSAWNYTSGSPFHRIVTNGGIVYDDTFAMDFNIPGDADAGRSVYAVESGEIIIANAATGQVIIRHDKPLTLDDGTVHSQWYSGYIHMTNIASTGAIQKGDSIGNVGDVISDNNHLHFGVYVLNGDVYESIDVANNRTDMFSPIVQWIDWCGANALPGFLRLGGSWARCLARNCRDLEQSVDTPLTI